MAPTWINSTLGLLLALAGTPGLAQTAPQAAQAPSAQKAQNTNASSQAKQAETTQHPDQGAAVNKPVVLDSVVAIINGTVLLQSDVEEEMRLEALQGEPPAEDTDVKAADRLITRTLMLQQMREQGQLSTGVKPADVERVLAELKKELPGCANRCNTDAGWTAFLAERSLTPNEVRIRWRQRLVILNYLNLRFREGVRIPRGDVQTYYDKTFVPEFTAKGQKAPALANVSERIQNVLVEQQVNKQIDDWAQTLRQEGEVNILVPAYGKSSSGDSDIEDFSGGGA